MKLKTCLACLKDARAEVKQLKFENDKLRHDINNQKQVAWSEKDNAETLETRNTNLREALEYYANNEVYRREYTTNITYITPIEKDKGARARKALKGITNKLECMCGNTDIHLHNRKGK